MPLHASESRAARTPRSIPRWAALTLAPLIWLVAVPFAHVVTPWAISLIGPRYGWQHGSPASWNSIGLLSVAAGVVVLVWLMVLGFAQAAQLPERVQLDWSPKIFFTRGPYEFSRHPMYLAELALWLGWAIFYGSLSVLAGFAVFAIVVSRLGPIEERALEARFGEQYRAYAKDVPRWLRIRSRSPWTPGEIMLFLGIGAACLIALVVGGYLSGPNVEEWDTPLFFRAALPLAAIGTFAGGLFFPGHSWRWAVAPWWMQFVYMLWRRGPGNLWPIALVFWMVVIVLFVGLARIGTTLSKRI